MRPWPGAARSSGSGWPSAKHQVHVWCAAPATMIASRNAVAVGAGHSFFVFVDDGYPVNVLNALKQVPEVCGIFCATANPVEIVVAETELGRGIVGVVDGRAPAGVEGEADVADRKSLLRAMGYKL
jgi:adenosine/AMP kinase